MKRYSAMILSGLLAVSMLGCADNTAETETKTEEEETETVTEKKYLSEEDITINETIENTGDGEHAILADGESASYSNTLVVKSGEASGDEADFYGENAAVYATNGAELTLSEMVVKTNGTHANAVFSYGEGTTVNISDSVIKTEGNCSGGIMTTGGGTMNANNLTIETSGNSSAAIRSDRGGGIVTVNGGKYTTSGKGSPVVYSTADITVNDAYMESTSSQGIVVEGKNSVTLNNVELYADNNSKNSDKSDWYQAVMIYQSMSGDAAEGESYFGMNGGTMTNANGDIFFVNNTVTTIELSDANIINNDSDGNFLRAAAAGWGNEGSNGGHVTMNASKQTIDGNMLVDSVSTLNLYLKDGSVFNGAVNPNGTEGEVFVSVEDGSKWTLTADSYITSLTCGTDAIDLNGHTLYINGEEYKEGTASEGEAIVVEISSGGGMPGSEPPGMPGGEPPEKPGGEGPGGGEPPEKPDGEPPAKPGEDH